jgi:hypothetical protein
MVRGDRICPHHLIEAYVLSEKIARLTVDRPQQAPGHNSAQPPTRLPDKENVAPNLNQAGRAKSLDHGERLAAH